MLRNFYVLKLVYLQRNPDCIYLYFAIIYTQLFELFPLFLLLKFVRSFAVLEPIEVSLGGVNIATLNLHYNNNQPRPSPANIMEITTVPAPSSLQIPTEPSVTSPLTAWNRLRHGSAWLRLRSK